MAEQLVNVTCGDGYTAAATAEFQRSTYKVTATIANQAVFYQVKRAPDGLRANAGDWTPEDFKTPGTGDIPFPFPIGGIRFRNAVATATDAQVTCRAS